jgi:SAM-dependent methyltransferase
MPRKHLYADPEIYDILHDEDTRADVSRFVRIARAVSPALRTVKHLRWLEPASGSGRYLLACAARGDTALGIDLSPAMIAYTLQQARTKPRIAGAVGGLVGRMEAFDAAKATWAGPRRAFASAHIAFNPINSIRHLATDAAMLKHLACVRDHVHPQGVYIIGLSLSAYGLESVSEDVWSGTRGGVTVTQVVQYEPPDLDATGITARRERVISHLTISRAGVADEHRDSAYWLRTYNLAQWTALIARSGWSIAATFANTGKRATPSEPGYFLFVLTPRAVVAAPRRKTSPRTP